MSLGENIKRLRQMTMVERAMTQAELAEKLGVTSASITGWEKGHNIPPLNKIINLAEILGVTIDELIKGSFHD